MALVEWGLAKFKEEKDYDLIWFDLLDQLNKKNEKNMIELYIDCAIYMIYHLQYMKYL